MTRNPRRLRSVKAWRQAQLRDAFVEYITLLNAELGETVGLAYVHGWRSKRYVQGLKLRLRIKSCCEDLGLPVPKWQYTDRVNAGKKKQIR